MKPFQHITASITLFLLQATAQSQTVLYTLTGDAPDDRFGVSSAQVGDLDGDGIGDFAVGAQFDDDGGSNAGSVRVFSGASGSILFTLHGDAPSGFFGFAVGGAGDVNHDGVRDIIVGAFGDDSFGANSGKAQVISGSDGAVLHTSFGDSSDGFGGAVTGVGDIDGDSTPDFLIGSVNDSVAAVQCGSARLFSGADGSLLRTLSGEFSNDLFGVSVANVGDLNGDGRAELLIGASFTDFNASNAGSAYLFSGIDGSLLYRLDGSTVGGNFGTSVNSAGDVNGDGVSDLIVGARNDATAGGATGSAYVFSGSDGALLHRFDGIAAGDSFGRSVSGAGDVNGDGFADVLVGASLNDQGGIDAGAVYIFSGLDGTSLGVVYGAVPGGFFGASVGSVGDVNNDGYADVIAGASVGNTAIVYSLITSRLAIDGLVSLITGLELAPAAERSLLRRATNARSLLMDSNPNNDRAVVPILVAFILEVEVRRGRSLMEEHADLLRNAAIRLIRLVAE